MLSDKELVECCCRNDQAAQELLYRRYASKMYGVCLRYGKNRMEAQDIMQEGFIRVFTNLKSFRGDGSLEGWVRRTIVNTAINIYNKNLNFSRYLDIDQIEGAEIVEEDIIGNISEKELLKVIQELPEGYRLVFNLYVIEGYNHKEIGKMLNISENTSKSQLSRARASLKIKIKNQYNIFVYERTA